MALFLKSQLKSSRTTDIHYSKQGQNLPPGAITEFVWKDYSPELFRDIQALKEIKFEDYMSSICSHEMLMELTMSRGSDRPFCCFSHDKRFIIKTLHKSKVKVLIDMLPSYYEHIKMHESTLLTRYYGLHSARPASGSAKVFFVVTENLVADALPLDMMYDLKGASKRRTRSQQENDLTSVISRDQDFNFCFLLDAPTRAGLLQQIRIDCKFLEEQGLMNYSLMLAFHIESQDPENGIDSSAKTPTSHLRRDPSLSYLVPRENASRVGLGAEIPAHAIRILDTETESMSRSQKPRAEEASMKVYLYMGIVNLLHNYNIVKRFEHAYKSLHHDSRAIACVKPPLYSARFQAFLSNVFLPDED